MQFEEIPVSHYTGQPNISIPLHSKSLNGDLDFNMALSYNTQGIKINNYSSWTGTGWNLIAGGSISRTVRDVPDDLLINSNGYSGIKTGVFHLDEYWNYNNLTPIEKEEFNYKAVGTSLNKYDSDVDLYQFNFMGITGRFVIVKENHVFVPKLISQGQALDIEFTMDNSTKEISAFTIRDTKGYIYEFNTVERSSSETAFGSKAQGTDTTYDITLDNLPEIIQINSAWHISSIKTPNGITLASFAYADRYENYTVSVTHTINRVTSLLGNTSFSLSDLGEPCTSAKLKPFGTLSWLYNTSWTKKLSSVTFKDGTSVELISDNTHPETGGGKLNTVHIKNANNAINKSYSLTYETTVDNSLTSPRSRLWLTKLTETAGSTNHDYILDYNSKENLPGFNSNDQDNWGYYSGIDFASVNCNGATPTTYSDDIIKTGLLSSITYPSGGVKSFDFEHHTYSYEGNQAIGLDDYIVNPRNSSLQSQFTDDFIYNHTGTSAPTVPIDTFTIGFTQDIYISSWVTATPSQYLQDHRIMIYQGTPQQSFAVLELDIQCQVVKNLPPGTYTMALTPWDNINFATYQIAGDYRVTYLEQSLQPREEMIGGGVRIKSVSFKDTPNTTAKTTNYYYEDEQNNLKSSGVIDAELDRLTRNYTLSQNYVNLENGDGYVTYDVMERGNRAQLSQGEYVGYRSVKVSETGNGYTIYNHTSAFESPSPANVFDMPNPYPAPNLDYKRGLLTKKRVYREDGNILQEVSHYDDTNTLKYDFTENTLFTSRLISKSQHCPWFPFYDWWTSYTTNIQDGQVTSCDPPGEGSPSYQVCDPWDLLNHATVFKSGWARPKEVYTTDYFYDGGVTRTKKTKQVYSYNIENFQVSYEEASYDKGGSTERILTKYYYPVGATLNTTPSHIRSKMRDLNMVNTVLETQVYRNETLQHATQEKINETHNIYDEFHTDLVALKEIKVEKANQGAISRIQFHDYDTHGNILDVSKTDGSRISYLWGQNRTRPIAQLSNVAYNSIPNSYKTVNGNFSPSQESALRGLFPDAMISVFNYDPLKGVISTSDDKGYIMTYEYDDFNRLKRVKDADGNIVGENTYHYINEY
ncbi:hypothetical protein GCM10011444_14580 [Winogradskyella haliclonae]|uniref:YD repeat-containing protein n=2 Tax=Winogradskyella haliclonae TaxID=2048558 RepID=A0ABQ2BY47_9FLAO|nr:hypothetical protein GCM10011444_14580 [Winogradskyella haliclonae]